MNVRDAVERVAGEWGPAGGDMRTRLLRPAIHSNQLIDDDHKGLKSTERREKLFPHKYSIACA
jgi:hypothetical protein